MFFVSSFEAVAHHFAIVSASWSISQEHITVLIHGLYFDPHRQTVVIRLADMSLHALESAMHDDVTSLGLGPEFGYVRSRQHGRPLLIAFPSKGTSWLFTVERAVEDFLLLDHQGRSEFAVKLGAFISDAISSVRESGGSSQAATQSPFLDVGSHENEHCDPWRLSFHELKWYLELAASIHCQGARLREGSCTRQSMVQEAACADETSGSAAEAPSDEDLTTVLGYHEEHESVGEICKNDDLEVHRLQVESYHIDAKMP
jgi:hypothetical protein